MGLKNIIKGHYHELVNNNEEVAKRRISICVSCPLYLPNFGGQCNGRLYLNPDTGEVSTKPKQGFVQGCYCRLQAKTRLLNEQCPAGKW